MLFSGIPFLYYFLPVTLLLYFAAPNRCKNAVLLFASLFFYGWGEPKYLLLMVSSILFGYVLGILIEHFRERWQSRFFLIVSVVLSLGTLGFFKYASFFIGNFRALTGISVPLLRIALPIGISFYTFQILSYTVDVYRGEVPAQKNPIALAAYVSMFPQLIAGPIVRYKDIDKQLVERKHSFADAAYGIRRFVLGLSKKVLLANALGELCGIFRASSDLSVLFFWLNVVAFMLQIYFDFSGYSDMAIGLGHIFGFSFLENFIYPYISRSITEFWRRWHISLGSWFRDYVYIPLGGNRGTKARQLRNILVVWMLTGFWHGAEWNFVVWGLYFAVLLILEKMWLSRYLAKSKVLFRVYVMFFVIISFVIFQGENMGQVLSDLGGMFGAKGVPLVSREFLYYLRSYAGIILISIIGATPLPKKMVERLHEKPAGDLCLKIAEPVVLGILLLVVTAYLVDGSFNPFLYFRF